MEEIKAKTRAFLSRFFRGHELRDDEDFFAQGFVNSLFAMQLVQFVESEFQLTVEPEDLELSNFNSVDAIAALVGRKTAA
jgi:acyl carrier protein